MLGEYGSGLFDSDHRHSSDGDARGSALGHGVPIAASTSSGSSGTEGASAQRSDPGAFDSSDSMQDAPGTATRGTMLVGGAIGAGNTSWRGAPGRGLAVLHEGSGDDESDEEDWMANIDMQIGTGQRALDEEEIEFRKARLVVAASRNVPFLYGALRFSGLLFQGADSCQEVLQVPWRVAVALLVVAPIFKMVLFTNILDLFLIAGATLPPVVAFFGFSRLLARHTTFHRLMRDAPRASAASFDRFVIVGVIIAVLMSLAQIFAEYRYSDSGLTEKLVFVIVDCTMPIRVLVEFLAACVVSLSARALSVQLDPLIRDLDEGSTGPRDVADRLANLVRQSNEVTRMLGWPAGCYGLAVLLFVLSWLFQSLVVSATSWGTIQWLSLLYLSLLLANMLLFLFFVAGANRRLQLATLMLSSHKVWRGLKRYCEELGESEWQLSKEQAHAQGLLRHVLVLLGQNRVGLRIAGTYVSSRRLVLLAYSLSSLGIYALRLNVSTSSPTV